MLLDSAGDYPAGETGWGNGPESGTLDGSGGGLSTTFAEPSWQTGVVPSSVEPPLSAMRAVPDVAWDAGAVENYSLYTSTIDVHGQAGWVGGGDGTSIAAPQWAGLIAIADQGRALAGGTPLTGYSQTLSALYSLPASDFHDIVNGNNGDPAGPGYDLVTGLGSPVANLLVPDLAGYEIASNPVNAPSTTQITVTTTPAAPVYGQAVTLSATVSVVSPGTGIPTGTVTFTLGSTVLGTASLDSNGVATLTTTPASAGTETITVAYSGDPDDAPSSVPQPLTVAPAAATLTLENLNVT